MPAAHLPGVDLWYADSGGDGVPVVFVHAASGTSRSWQYQVPAFTAAGYRCISYDRRGAGQSRPTDPALQPGSVVDDLHGLVDQLRLDRLHLVGTAAGAGVAMQYALSHPERLRSLVLADGTGGLSEPDYLEVHRRARPPEIEDLPVYLRELSAGYRGTQPEGTAAWIEIAGGSEFEHGTFQRQTRPHQVTYARLAEFRVPTLVLVGQADLMTPPTLARMLAAAIPNCQFATVPEAGHAAFWERPDDWNALVLDFLRQH